MKMRMHFSSVTDKKMTSKVIKDGSQVLIGPSNVIQASPSIRAKKLGHVVENHFTIESLESKDLESER